MMRYRRENGCSRLLMAVAHALNNGLAVAVISVPAVWDYFVKNRLQFVPIKWSLAGLVVCAVGLWLAARGGSPSQQSS